MKTTNEELCKFNPHEDTNDIKRQCFFSIGIKHFHEEAKISSAELTSESALELLFRNVSSVDNIKGSFNSHRELEMPTTIHPSSLLNKLFWAFTYWKQPQCYISEQKIVKNKGFSSSTRLFTHGHIYKRTYVQRHHHKHSPIPRLPHAPSPALSTWPLLPRASPLDTSKSFPYFFGKCPCSTEHQRLPQRE